jgi:hypothetical protein
MKQLTLLLLFPVFMLISCSKERPEAELSVLEFYDYCSTDYNACGEPLNHEGGYVTIIGYVHALNTFEEDNRFHVFQEATIESNRVEIHVIDKSEAIFSEIAEHVDAENSENFTKFRITGKITGQDLPTNDNCQRAPFIDLDSARDIKVID